MKIVILEAESLGEDMKLDRFFEIGEVAIYGKTTLEELPGRIAEADAVIVNKLPMNEETLKDAQYLKYIGLTATGNECSRVFDRGSCAAHICNDAISVGAPTLLRRLRKIRGIRKQ